MDATFWAFISLLLFFGILFYFKVPSKLTSALDTRAARIRQELDDARELRDEAKSILADYERRKGEAEEEASSIVKQAEAEARRMTEETNQALQDMIERRTKAAEQKISQAEKEAIQLVRARAADLAKQATRKVLAENLKESQQEALLTASVQDVKRLLN